jgi:SAM-dependent methyltransferase
MASRAFYDLGYRWAPRMPWEVGPRAELVSLVSSGVLPPGRAIDLGCGTGANAVHLAERGFDVTGVDFAAAGLAKAAARASAAGVSPRWVRADLTDLPPGLGTFELLVDYGTLDDLTPAQRDSYVDNVVPLAAPGARFLLWCFEWAPRRFDRWFSFPQMAPGEVQARFGHAFEVARIAATDAGRWRLIAGTACYLMTRLSAS